MPPIHDGGNDCDNVRIAARRRRRSWLAVSAERVISFLWNSIRRRPAVAEGRHGSLEAAGTPPAPGLDSRESQDSILHSTEHAAAAVHGRTPPRNSSPRAGRNAPMRHLCDACVSSAALNRIIEIFQMEAYQSKFYRTKSDFHSDACFATMIRNIDSTELFLGVCASVVSLRFERLTSHVLQRLELDLLSGRLDQCNIRSLSEDVVLAIAPLLKWQAVAKIEQLWPEIRPELFHFWKQLVACLQQTETESKRLRWPVPHRCFESPIAASSPFAHRYCLERDIFVTNEVDRILMSIIHDAPLLDASCLVSVAAEDPAATRLLDPFRELLLILAVGAVDSIRAVSLDLRHAHRPAESLFAFPVDKFLHSLLRLHTLELVLDPFYQGGAWIADKGAVFGTVAQTAAIVTLLVSPLYRNSLRTLHLEGRSIQLHSNPAVIAAIAALPLLERLSFRGLLADDDHDAGAASSRWTAARRRGHDSSNESKKGSDNRKHAPRKKLVERWAPKSSPAASRSSTPSTLPTCLMRQRQQQQQQQLEGEDTPEEEPQGEERRTDGGSEVPGAAAAAEGQSYFMPAPLQQLAAGWEAESGAGVNASAASPFAMYQYPRIHPVDMAVGGKPQPQQQQIAMSGRDDNISALAAILSMSQAPLSSLVVAEANIGDRGCMLLCRALVARDAERQRQHAGYALALPSNGIGAAGGRAVVWLMHALGSSLRRLDLSGNYIGKAAPHISLALPPSVTHLDLSQAALEKTTCRALLAVLSVGKHSLVSLNVANCSIHAADVAMVLEAAGHCLSLSAVDVSRNFCDGSALAVLVQSLQRNSELQQVVMRHMRVFDAEEEEFRRQAEVLGIVDDCRVVGLSLHRPGIYPRREGHFLLDAMAAAFADGNGNRSRSERGGLWEFGQLHAASLRRLQDAAASDVAAMQQVFDADVLFGNGSGSGNSRRGGAVTL